MPLEFYFDNYFTSLPLINHLTTMNYGGTRTIQENRASKQSPIKSVKAMQKESKGAIDVAFDSNTKISVVRWNDNSVVTLVSNQVAVAPLQSARRWSASEKKHVSVDQPIVVQRNNAYMEGTNRMDQNINCYRTVIKTKKWWWPIFSWMLDVAEPNSWLIHRSERSDMSQLEFRVPIARTYLKQAEVRKSIGRFKVLSSCVRFDIMGHYVVPLGRQVWKCAMEGCKSRPSPDCVKCAVGLCIKCFMPYHQK